MLYWLPTSEVANMDDGATGTSFFSVCSKQKQLVKKKFGSCVCVRESARARASERASEREKERKRERENIYKQTHKQHTHTRHIPVRLASVNFANLRAVDKEAMVSWCLYMH
jgi:hypothetical protein